MAERCLIGHRFKVTGGFSRRGIVKQKKACRSGTPFVIIYRNGILQMPFLLLTSGRGVRYRSLTTG